MSLPLSAANPVPFVLGVNYWPRRKAMDWWKEFDAEEVREEFTVIRDLGLSLVRIFLLWEDFQPEPDRVSVSALNDLETVADIAAGLGLTLDITFFTGHMSGPNWAPSWLLHGPKPEKIFMQVISQNVVVDSGYLNPYTDPLALKAERLLIRTVIERLRQHPGVGIWNLGNEPDIFAWPPDAASGAAWALEMMTLVRDLDPAHPVTCGLCFSSLQEDNGLRVHEVFASADFGVMHGYPMFAGWSRSPLDEWFVPFTCALTAALSGKPVLAEEFGACTNRPGEASGIWEFTRYGRPRAQFMAGETEFAHHLERVLENLLTVGALGAVLWCFADYALERWDRAPCDESIQERHFGLVRPDGTLKPHAEVIRRFAASQPTVRPALSAVSLDITPQAFYEAPLEHAKRLYQAFLETHLEHPRLET